MTENWFEAAIIVAIIAGIMLAVWKGGAANPEGTGSLGRKVSRLDGDVHKFGGELVEVSRRLAEVEKNSAKVQDIKRLETAIGKSDDKIDELLERTAAISTASEHRGHQLDMVYQAIVQKGMK